LDLATSKVEWTEELYRMYGFDPSLPPPPYTEHMKLFTPESWERLSTDLDRTAETGIPYELELETVKSDGSSGWMWVRGEAVYNTEGQIIGLWGAAQDITQRKQTEDALRRSEERFRNLVDAAPEGIFVQSEGRFMFLNPAMVKIFGASKANQIVGTELMARMAPESHEAIRSRIRVQRETGESVPLMDQVYLRLDGSRVPVEATAVPIRFKDQDAHLVFVRDISERKRAESRLKFLERRNQALLDHSPLCHKIVDLNLNLQYMSGNGFKMLKLDANADVYGKPYPFYFFPEPFKKLMTENLLKVKRTGEILTNEGLANDVEGNEVWLESTLIPIFDDQGEIEYLTVVTADISKRKHDENEQKHLEKQLWELQKMESIGNLAAGIAHDFNNILFPIMGMSELLLEDLPEGTHEYQNAEEIFRAGKRGRNLVKQILAFSRQSEHRMVPTRLQNILKEVYKLSRSTIPTDIDIQQKIQTDCGLVLADPSQLHQIGMNLVTNAFHAVQETGGRISLELSEQRLEDDENIPASLSPGRYAILSVTDNGHGIPSHLIDKIFDPYFTTKKQDRGTGLGLAVVYGIVKEHRGEIVVHSQPGEKTCFAVYLPLLEKNQEDFLNRPEMPIDGGDERILLVDDEEAIAKLEKQMLERLGYDVVSRISGVDALEAFEASPSSYDLVVTDMSMPNLPGDKLARKIKSIRPDMPIIVCTGFSERVHEDNFKQMGIDGLLMKPIVKSDLAKTVRKVLDDHNLFGAE
jgi:PAS domain S-box-containing protein